MSEQEHGHHIVQPKTYAVILLALFLLTGITVSVAFVNIGPFNDLVAMSVACTKTLLVVLFFMHLRYSSKLTQLVAGAAFLWFAIMIVLLLSDFWSRNWIPAPQGW
jgi:cytochrome c oxidase subunit 4